MEGGSCIAVLVAGSEFHADGPATAKLRGPYRTVLVTGLAIEQGGVIWQVISHNSEIVFH